MAIDKKDFDFMLKDLDKYYVNREKLILISREIVKLSKLVIYAVHRKGNAEKPLSEMQDKMKDMNAILSKDSRLYGSGSHKIAVQEYVEALCYHDYIIKNKIPTRSELNVETEFYLMGLCDLTGELVRRAINAGIDGNYSRVIEVKEFIGELYDELLRFNIYGPELRKKFDSIKYDLKKLEELVYGLKIKDKI